jgi:hypothetical protein
MRHCSLARFSSRGALGMTAPLDQCRQPFETGSKENNHKDSKDTKVFCSTFVFFVALCE